MKFQFCFIQHINKQHSFNFVTSDDRKQISKIKQIINMEAEFQQGMRVLMMTYKEDQKIVHDLITVSESLNSVFQDIQLCMPC